MAKAKSRVSTKVKKQAVKRASAKAKARPAKRARAGKWVYAFGDGRAEGKASMRNLLGGKGAGLAEMANLGLPVPPGFTITTEVCTYFYAHDRQDLRRQRQSALGLGALGCPRLDAGHDGHRAQPRPQRRDRRGSGEEIRRPALRV